MGVFRRTTPLIAALAIAGPWVVAASAQPILPTHQTTETRHVHEAVTAVHVTGDVSNITIHPGDATTVVAHEGWNFDQPQLKVSVTDGQLDVSVTCGNGPSIGPVYVSLANDCTDDLDLTVPALAPVVATSSDGWVSTRGMQGGQRLHSDTNKVTVLHAVGKVFATTDDGQISATDVDGVSVELHSDTGDLVASSITGNLIATSSDGVVSVTNTVADTIAAKSGINDVSVSNSHARRVVASADGSLRVIGVHARSFDLRNDTGPVLLYSANAPAHVTALSSDGTVTVEVPSGRYAVTAASTDGHVHVSGIIRDASSSRQLVARSDTANVTISGF